MTHWTNSNKKNEQHLQEIGGYVKETKGEESKQRGKHISGYCSWNFPNLTRMANIQTEEMLWEILPKKTIPEAHRHKLLQGWNERKNVKAPIETGLLVQGTSHKPWWLTGVVKPAGVEGARVKEAWQPPPRFQRMYEKAWVTRQKPAAGMEPSQRTSTKPVWRGNVGLEAPQSPHWGTAQWSCGKGATVLQTPKWLILQQLPPCAWKSLNSNPLPCKVTRAELPMALGAHPLYQCALVRHNVKTWSQRRLFGIFKTKRLCCCISDLDRACSLSFG